MQDGRELESIVRSGLRAEDVNVVQEMKTAISDIQAIRGRYLISYIANTVNQELGVNVGIESRDDLPFNEMINSVPKRIKEVDLVIVTPGGDATQVDKFVDTLRSRFESVSIIILNIAMSAGTILAMSGDEIVMTNSSYIGPIDPQSYNREGRFVPSQSIITLISEIQRRGDEKIQKREAPDWTDLNILNRIDPKDIGAAYNASNFSVELVQNYLFKYKFKFWDVHSTTGERVTDEEKMERAKDIASKLCNHSYWKSHGRGITRETALSELKLLITKSEDIAGLDRSLKRFWALLFYIFERAAIYKIFLSDDYTILKNIQIKK